MSKSNSTKELLSKKKSVIKKNKQLKNRCLEQLNLDAAGIDIGSRSHFVSVPEDRDEVSVREFGTFTEDLHKLAHWLKECKIKTIAMESTGVYWIPAYEILVSHGFEVYLVDARHVKNVCGRKSDVIDCQWIQQLHTYGLLRGAFIPESSVCALRSYVKQREHFIREGGQYIQRMQKAMQQMNVQLHHVVRDITGVTGMKIIRSILEGERDPMRLAQNREKGCKNSVEVIAKALVGNYRSEHMFALRQSVELYDYMNEKVRECDEAIEQALKGLEESGIEVAPKSQSKKKARKNMPTFDVRGALIKMTGVDLTEIPGIEGSTALSVISVIGKDMDSWKTDKHFTSWLGLAPGTKISGGKRLSSRSKPTKNRASESLRLAAQALHRSKSALGAYYRRLRGRIGGPKAITATARKLAVLIYRMLKYKIEYKDSGQDYYEQNHKARVIKNLKQKAKQFGFELQEILAAEAETQRV